jgi:hypothetical protein
MRTRAVLRRALESSVPLAPWSRGGRQASPSPGRAARPARDPHGSRGGTPPPTRLPPPRWSAPARGRAGTRRSPDRARRVRAAAIPAAGAGKSETAGSSTRRCRDRTERREPNPHVQQRRPVLQSEDTRTRILRSLSYSEPFDGAELLAGSCLNEKRVHGALQLRLYRQMPHSASRHR